MNAPMCARCAMPLAYAEAPCPHCQGEGPKLFDRIVALGTYEDPLRAMILAVKYHKAWPLAEYLAERLAAQKRVKELLERAEVIVPVPLHPWRRWSRGFNQTEVIAGKLARRGVAVRHPLVRLKATETQTHFHSRASREANLENAFGLDRARFVRGRHVVLVDDVMTTGATMRAAARELRKAEPAEISGVVVAIADPRGRQFQRI
jgi:ComF family protein